MFTLAFGFWLNTVNLTQFDHLYQIERAPIDSDSTTSRKDSFLSLMGISEAKEKILEKTGLSEAKEKVLEKSQQISEAKEKLLDKTQQIIDKAQEKVLAVGAQYFPRFKPSYADLSV